MPELGLFLKSARIAPLLFRPLIYKGASLLRETKADLKVLIPSQGDRGRPSPKGGIAQTFGA
jgi:hypothetical protein